MILVHALVEGTFFAQNAPNIIWQPGSMSEEA